jgi:hypothetical protein
LTGRPLPTPAGRRPRVPVPALVALAALVAAAGGIALSQRYWGDLQGSMERMDRSLETARASQRQLALYLAQAQDLLLAQQRHLQESEERLREATAAAAALQSSLEGRQARLARLETERGQSARLARDLAHRLDLTLAGLAEPAGADLAQSILDDLMRWRHPPPAQAGGEDPAPGAGADLDRALDQLQSALTESRTAPNGVWTPARVGQAIQALGGELAELAPQHPRLLPPGPTGLAASVHVAGQLQSALIALQRGDQTMYTLSLDAAAAWLGAYYDPSRPQVVASRGRIAELRALPVRQDRTGLRTALARTRAALGEWLVQAESAGIVEAPAPPASGEGPAAPQAPR